MSRRKEHLVLLGFATLVLIFILSGPAEVLENAGRIRLDVIPSLLLLFSASVFMRTLKWKMVLDETKNVPLTELVPVNLSGVLFRDTLPAKAGEPLKALLLKDVFGVPASKGIVSVMWDRVMDFLGVSTFGLMFLLGLGGVGGSLAFTGLLGAAAVVLGCALVVTALTRRAVGEKIFKQFMKMPFFYKLFTKSRLDSFYSVRVSLRNVLINYLLTLLAIYIEGLLFFLVFGSMGIEVDPFYVVSAFSFSVLCGFVSFLPAGLGSLEAVFIFSLMSRGLTQSQAAAGVIATRSFGLLLMYALGIVSHVLIVKRGMKR